MISQHKARDNITGTTAKIVYRAKPRLRDCPISITWGLPIRVAAEPMLAEHARARRYGTGSLPFLTHPWIRTGVIARQTMSLESSAERPAEVPISTARKDPEDISRAAILRETSE